VILVSMVDLLVVSIGVLFPASWTSPVATEAALDSAPDEQGTLGSIDEDVDGGASSRPGATPTVAAVAASDATPIATSMMKKRTPARSEPDAI